MFCTQPLNIFLIYLNESVMEIYGIGVNQNSWIKDSRQHDPGIKTNVVKPTAQPLSAFHFGTSAAQVGSIPAKAQSATNALVRADQKQTGSQASAGFAKQTTEHSSRVRRYAETLPSPSGGALSETEDFFDIDTGQTIPSIPKPPKQENDSYITVAKIPGPDYSWQGFLTDLKEAAKSPFAELGKEFWKVTHGGYISPEKERQIEQHGGPIDSVVRIVPNVYTLLTAVEVSANVLESFTVPKNSNQPLTQSKQQQLANDYANYLTAIGAVRYQNIPNNAGAGKVEAPLSSNSGLSTIMSSPRNHFETVFNANPSLKNTEWSHPISQEKLNVTRLADSGELVALRETYSNTAKIIDWETGEPTGALAHRDSVNEPWYRGGLKGGNPNGTTLGLQYSSKEEANTNLVRLKNIENLFIKAEKVPAQQAQIVTNLKQALQIFFPNDNLSTLSLEQLKANYLPKIQAEKNIAFNLRKDFESQKTTAIAMANQSLIDQAAQIRAQNNPTAQQQVNLAKLHLVNDPALISEASMDIMGTHNQAHFKDKINKINDLASKAEIEALGIVPGSAQIKNQAPHSTAPGIYQIDYEYAYYPKAAGGAPMTTGPAKSHMGIKTVYDPQVMSDENIEQLGIRGFAEVQKSLQGQPSTAIVKIPNRQYQVEVDTNKKLSMEFWVDQYGNLNSFYPIA